MSEPIHDEPTDAEIVRAFDEAADLMEWEEWLFHRGISPRRADRALSRSILQGGFFVLAYWFVFAGMVWLIVRDFSRLWGTS